MPPGLSKPPKYKVIKNNPADDNEVGKVYKRMNTGIKSENMEKVYAYKETGRMQQTPKRKFYKKGSVGMGSAGNKRTKVNYGDVKHFCGPKGCIKPTNK